MPIIPALSRVRQDDLEFKASLGYTVRPCLKNLKKKRKIGSGYCSETDPNCLL
jgi:hypothetical protein